MPESLNTAVAQQIAARHIGMLPAYLVVGAERNSYLIVFPKYIHFFSVLSGMQVDALVFKTKLKGTT
jgi:hypothetical protein